MIRLPIVDLSALNFRAFCLVVFMFMEFSFAVYSKFVFAEIIDRVVANIDGEPVTEAEIRELISPLLLLSGAISENVEGDKSFNESPSGSKSGLGMLSPDIMKEAIMLLLFEKEAAKIGLSISDDDISSYIAQVEASNNAEPGSLHSALKEQGITLEAYRAKIRSEMLRSRVLSVELRSRIQISDQEVDEYLKGANSDDKQESVKGEFSLIKVSFIDSADSSLDQDNSREKMEMARATIRQEKSCSGLHSAGVFCENLGVVNFDDLKEDLQKLVSNSSEFVPSEIVNDSGMAFYFRGPVRFSRENSRIRDEIKQKLFQEKFQEAAEKYLKEDIFNKYHVEIY
ncbi:MAG TPA: SurA N-terminal domain-containing protein [Oligoflexia bacterium]|nr:SurA N-terminal domain-containing protein [Oligoflexia bacterium]HMP48808.1 SurA N-terminal domain-containing protein [Oligoflexia bacterium]